MAHGRCKGAVSAPGQTTAEAHVPVLADSAGGSNEYVVLSFRNATNANMGGFYGLGFGVITPGS